MHQLLQEWSALLNDQPTGRGASPVHCERALHSFPRDGSLVCLSDGISTTSAEGGGLILQDEVAKLRGGALRAHRVIYVCVIDPDIEMPPQLVLTSPEDPLSTGIQLEGDKRDDSRLAIQRHREEQRELFCRRRRCSWLELIKGSELESAYLEVRELLSL